MNARQMERWSPWILLVLVLLLPEHGHGISRAEQAGADMAGQ